MGLMQILILDLQLEEKKNMKTYVLGPTGHPQMKYDTSTWLYIIAGPNPKTPVGL